MNITDFKKMSTTERLQAMEALWDSLLYEGGEIESPKWHERILEERKSNIAEGRAKFVSLADLKASRRQ
jgi:Putative addiction module component